MRLASRGDGASELTHALDGLRALRAHFDLGLSVLALVLLATFVPARARAAAKSSNYTGTYKMKEREQRA